MLLSLDKLTELDVIVDDDEGCVWVTIIFVTAVAFSVVGVGVLDASGDGDLVQQFFIHKSGVIKFSTKRYGIEKHKLIYGRLRKPGN